MLFQWRWRHRARLTHVCCLPLPDHTTSSLSRFNQAFLLPWDHLAGPIPLILTTSMSLLDPTHALRRKFVSRTHTPVLGADFLSWLTTVYVKCPLIATFHAVNQLLLRAFYVFHFRGLVRSLGAVPDFEVLPLPNPVMTLWSISAIVLCRPPSNWLGAEFIPRNLVQVRGYPSACDVAAARPYPLC